MPEIKNQLQSIESKLDHKADKADIEKLYAELSQKADKVDIERLDKRIDVIENKLDQKADKTDIEKLYAELDKKADKTDLLPLITEISALRTDVTTLQNQMSQVIALLEKQSQTLDIIRTEQKAISKTLSLHEERIARLEEKVFGYRIREDKEKYK
jgi:chromosome segregation ATPase